MKTSRWAIGSTHSGPRGAPPGGRSGAAQQGREAEAWAARWLAALGFRVIARNVRTPFGEVDLLAYEGDVLCVIEVKARRSASHGTAAEGIRRRQRLRLQRAARYAVAWLCHRGAVRIDVVALDYRYDRRGDHGRPTPGMPVGWRMELIRGALEAPET